MVLVSSLAASGPVTTNVVTEAVVDGSTLANIVREAAATSTTTGSAASAMAQGISNDTALSCFVRRTQGNGFTPNVACRAVAVPLTASWATVVANFSVATAATGIGATVSIPANLANVIALFGVPSPPGLAALVAPPAAVAQPVTMTFLLTPSCFLDGKGSDSLLRLRITPPVRPLTSQEVEVLRTLDNQQIAVAVLGGFAGPSVAAQGARAAFAVAMLNCDPRDVTLDWIQHPTDVSVGAGMGAPFAGAAIMNLVFVAALSLGHLSIAFMLHVLLDESLSIACERVRFPSMIAFPAMLLAGPTAQSATMAVVFGDLTQRACGVASMLLTIIITTFIFHRLVSDRFTAVLVRIPTVDGGNGGVLHTIGQWLHGEYEWEDGTVPGYVHRNGMFFHDYNDRVRWFYGAELVLTILTGMLEGIKLGSGQCDYVAITFVSLLGVYLIFLIIRRPHLTYAELLFAILLTCLELASGTAFVVGRFGENPEAMAFVMTLVPSTMYVVLVKAGFELVQFIFRMVSHVLVLRAVKQKARLQRKLKRDMLNRGKAGQEDTSGDDDDRELKEVTHQTFEEKQEAMADALLDRIEREHMAPAGDGAAEHDEEALLDAQDAAQDGVVGPTSTRRRSIVLPVAAYQEEAEEDAARDNDAHTWQEAVPESPSTADVVPATPWRHLDERVALVTRPPPLLSDRPPARCAPRHPEAERGSHEWVRDRSLQTQNGDELLDIILAAQTKQDAQLAFRLSLL